MAMAGLVGAEMEVVDGMHAVQKQGVVGRCRSTSREQTDTLIAPPSRCAALGRVEPDFFSLLGKALTRDTTRWLRFVVHAADWLHCMLLHERR